METLISVIVPVYNAEMYLERTILSVLAQTYENFELLLIDDGALDRSGNICDRYAQEDIRVYAYHKDNGGLSDARNYGLDRARGEYIAFLDADDFLAPKYLETLYCACQRGGCKLSICQFQETVEDAIQGKKTEHAEIGDCTEVEIQERETLLRYMFQENCREYLDYIVAWNKLYHRSLWEEIRFPVGRIHEDEATTYRLLDKAGKAAYVKQTLYGYYQNQQSLTRTAFTISRMDCLTALKERIEFFLEKGEIEFIKYSYKAYADTSIQYYQAFKQGRTKENAESFKQCQRELYGNVRFALEGMKTCLPKGEKLPFRTRIGYRLFLISPALYESALQFIKTKERV